MKQILYISFILFSILSFGQQRKVSGIVKDSIGEVIPGVGIIIEGTNSRTNTDFDGKYLINVNPNNFLVFSFVGMKTQRIIADKNEINVQLQETTPLKEEYGPAYYPYPKRKFDATTTRKITKKDIENIDNPKYDFNKNAKNNVFVIFIPELTHYDFRQEDLEFQQKYNVKYSLIGNQKIDYITKYNKLTFKYLKKKYKKTWQAEIRKDVIGLEKYLK